MIAPSWFQLDDIDGHASAVDDDVPEEIRGQVREAMQSCPEQAIVESITDNGAGAPS